MTSTLKLSLALDLKFLPSKHLHHDSKMRENLMKIGLTKLKFKYKNLTEITI